VAAQGATSLPLFLSEQALNIEALIDRSFVNLVLLLFFFAVSTLPTNPSIHPSKQTLELR
jgi:hypothetical protein